MLRRAASEGLSNMLVILGSALLLAVGPPALNESILKAFDAGEEPAVIPDVPNIKVF